MMFHAYFKDFDRAPFKVATAMKCFAPNHAWIRYIYIPKEPTTYKNVGFLVKTSFFWKTIEKTCFFQKTYISPILGL